MAAASTAVASTAARATVAATTTSNTIPVAPTHLVAASAAHTAVPDARRQGALYRVSRDGQTSYLFGTVHVGTKAFYPLAPEVSRALGDATRLVVELDTRVESAFREAIARHGRYGAGDDISKHVRPDTLARLTAALHAVGIPLHSVSHLKAWLLSNLLMGLELERNGFERSHGLETFLLAQAQTRGTAVAELESADYQMAMFDTMADADAERYLREGLRDLADGSSLRKAKALIDAWASGNASAIDALIVDATSGDTMTSDFTRRTLLGKRNPEMAARIASLMQDGTTSFVGVGLLHLLGADGLPRLLAQRGYRVERLY